MKKLEYRILIESTKIENVTFSYETALSEANVKTNRMGVQNGLIKKNGVLSVTTLSFLKFCFSLKLTSSIFLYFTKRKHFNFFPFFSTVSRFKGSDETGIIMMP